MKRMKIIIDIPVEIYEHVKQKAVDGHDIWAVMRAIADGTPLADGAPHIEVYWQDIPSCEMTLLQARQAVAGLRKKLEEIEKNEREVHLEQIYNLAFDHGKNYALDTVLKIVNNETERAARKAFKTRKDLMDFMSFMRLQIKVLKEKKK